MPTPYSVEKYFQEAVVLLSSLIACPSFSREENKTADLLAQALRKHGCETQQIKHNIIARSQRFSASKPTLLLNSHHDTVKPNSSYTLDPFEPTIKDGKLYGLGSNDAGGALVSLLATFLHFSQLDISWNIVFVASAEEEISGKDGIAFVLDHIEPITLGIVGEPTSMKLAVAEKGLMVLDCTATGECGHAAYDDKKNAIYEAQKAIEWFQTYVFAKKSATLGPIRMHVTQIQAGTQHNVIPDKCQFCSGRTNHRCLYSLGGTRNHSVAHKELYH